MWCDVMWMGRDAMRSDTIRYEKMMMWYDVLWCDVTWRDVTWQIYKRAETTSVEYDITTYLVYKVILRVNKFEKKNSKQTGVMYKIMNKDKKKISSKFLSTISNL